MFILSYGYWGSSENQDDMFIWEKKEFDILVLGILDGHGWEVGQVTANCQGSILDFLHCLNLYIHVLALYFSYYKNVRQEWSSLVAAPSSAKYQDALAFTCSIGDFHLQIYGRCTGVLWRCVRHHITSDQPTRVCVQEWVIYQKCTLLTCVNFWETKAQLCCAWWLPQMEFGTIGNTRMSRVT